MGEKRKAPNVKENSAWENQAPGGEVETILDEYAARLAAIETAAARRAGETERTVEVLKDALKHHTKTCSPEWVRYVVGVLVGLLVTVIGFMVTRVYLGDDEQNKQLSANARAQVEILKDMGFINGTLNSLAAKMTGVEERIKELEHDRIRREALDDRRR